MNEKGEEGAEIKEKYTHLLKIGKTSPISLSPSSSRQTQRQTQSQ